MADFKYSPNWSDQASQCQNCQLFQTKEGKNACVPPDKTFEQALKEYGEASPNGHCNYFQKK